MNIKLLSLLTVLSCLLGVASIAHCQGPNAGYGGASYSTGRDGGERLPLLPCQCPSCKHWHPWINANYVMGWTKGSTAPPLVTTSSPAFGGVLPPRKDGGPVGDPRTLYGGDIGGGLGSGVKLDFGAWFSPDIGIGASFFGYQPETDDFGISSDPATGVPLLALPYVDVFPLAPPGNNARIISSPAGSPTGLGSGSIEIDHDTEILGAQVYLKTNLYNLRGTRFDLVGGYHFSRISDELTLSAFSTDLSAGAFLGGGGGTRLLHDRFDATNEFHGGSLGLSTLARRGRISVSMLAKASFGNMNQRVSISGLQTRTVAGVPTSAPAGTYALASNSGTYTQNVNAIIPEFEIKLGYDLYRGLNFTVGYHATYWSEVSLAANSISPIIDDRQFAFPGGNPLGNSVSPGFAFASTEYWLQGLTFGLEKQY